MQEKDFENNNNNNELKDVCDQLFYNKGSDLLGNVGVKNLGSMLEMNDQEFEDYLNEL